MSDYAWFAVKGIVMLSIIGLAVYLTNSGLPLLSLLLMPEFHDGSQDDKNDDAK